MENAITASGYKWLCEIDEWTNGMANIFVITDNHFLMREQQHCFLHIKELSIGRRRMRKFVCVLFSHYYFIIQSVVHYLQMKVWYNFVYVLHSVWVGALYNSILSLIYSAAFGAEIYLRNSKIHLSCGFMNLKKIVCLWGFCCFYHISR